MIYAVLCFFKLIDEKCDQLSELPKSDFFYDLTTIDNLTDQSALAISYLAIG